jgi:uncharacterized protein
LIKPDVILEILNGYSLSLSGVHGVSHWGRVLETGLRIAEENGADLKVVEYFAVFHDSRREREGGDSGHGRRGAELAVQLRSKLDLSEEQFEELKYACIHHTSGVTEGSVTVRTCWDSDRLDLWRVGIHPGEPFLCTEPAKQKELQAWAEERSEKGYIPQCSREWLRLLETE